VIKVELIQVPENSVEEMISFAALGCYKGTKPEMGKLMDIENNLFNPGHHTTLQHNLFTFWIEGIAVSDFTFGLHLASPFYNSSQRSGRFCGAMFINPDYDFIKLYIKTYWPKLSDYQLNLSMAFVKKGIEIYQDNLDKLTELSAMQIKKERPRATSKYIEQNARKFAQEQLRMFIPTIFPTADTYSVNLFAIAAMYATAHSPTMRAVTQQMVDEVLKLAPDIGYMFKRGSLPEWSPPWDDVEFLDTARKPRLELLLAESEGMVDPPFDAMHPLDLLHFYPGFMSNNSLEIKTRVEISVATMGQDQRHRTVKRGPPTFVKSFYTPPLVSQAGLGLLGLDMLKTWKDLFDKLPSSLSTALAPYGAMVRYDKTGPLNAVFHEAEKRGCWCAQEEIFHLFLLLRNSILEKNGKDSPLLKYFSPPCVKIGKCTEGKRYCGIDIRGEINCFIERTV